VVVAVIALLMNMQQMMAMPGKVFSEDAPLLPEFSQMEETSWLNSPPLTVSDLKGRVVLLDFWTLGCWNCYRSFPWLNALDRQYEGKDFQIIGIHSPEFAYEKDRGKLIEKIAEFQLQHPIMMDNNHLYWSALKNRFWPAFYLIDKQGRVRALYVGETHEGDKQAQTIMSTIDALLAE